MLTLRDLTGCALALLLAGCASCSSGAASTSGVHDQAHVRAGHAQVARSSSTARRRGTPRYFVQLAVPQRSRAGSAVLAVWADRSAMHRRSREYLLEVSGSGPTVRKLPIDTPHRAVVAVAALDHRHIWTSTGDCATVGFRIHLTSDGGHRWRQARMPGPNCAAGSLAALDFTEAHHGLLTVVYANGPGADLYRTGDAGRRWRHLASLNPQRPGPTLPDAAPVESSPDGTLWLAGGLCTPALWRSNDLGARWQRIDIPGVSHGAYEQPSILGDALVEPVVTGPDCGRRAGSRLHVFRSVDRGAHWQRVPVRLPAAAAHNPDADHLVAASARHFWLIRWNGVDDTVYESADAGAHWHAVDLAHLIAVAR